MSLYSQQYTHYVVIPPDGGWGWVIVAACFFLNFIIDGVTYTFGVFLEDIGESFHVHPTKVALASSLMSGFYYFFGPFSCALTNKFGFRIVGIIGCFASSGVFLVASYLQNLEVFLIVTGCLGGVSFNMIYTPCLLIVGFYFEKWRALTTAISVTGTSIGVMVFPPVVNNVLARYDWRTKFRIISGICIGCSLLIFTFIPVPPTLVFEKRSSIKSRQESLSTASRTTEIEDEGSIGSFQENQEEPRTFWYNLKWIYSNLHNILYPTIIHDEGDIEFLSGYIVNFPDAETVSKKAVSFVDTKDIQLDFISPNYEDEDQTCLQKCCNCCTCQRNSHRLLPIRPMYRDDILFPGSIYTLQEFENVRSTSVLTTASGRSLAYTLRVTRISAEEIDKERFICHEAIIRVLVTMLSVSLLKSPSFMLLVLSGFFTMIGLFTPFVFMIQRGVEIGLEPSRCTLLLTVIGISNTVGRIVSGTLSCCPGLNLNVISYVTLIMAGLITMGSCYMNTFEGQLIFTIVFGFCIATFTALRSVIIANMVGLEKLTNAFGMNILFYGIASFIGLPLANIIQNETERYSYTFLFAGAAFLLSGIILIPIERIAKWETRKKKRVIFQV